MNSLYCKQCKWQDVLVKCKNSPFIIHHTVPSSSVSEFRNVDSCLRIHNFITEWAFILESPGANLFRLSVINMRPLDRIKRRPNRTLFTRYWYHMSPSIHICEYVYNVYNVYNVHHASNILVFWNTYYSTGSTVVERRVFEHLWWVYGLFHFDFTYR